MPVIKLTHEFISNQLTCPDGKGRIEYCDKARPGLYVEVRQQSEGQGNYYFRYKNDIGKTCHQKIAKTNDISLTEARLKAKQLKADIALGADLRGEAKARQAVPTYSDFMLKKYLPYATLHKRSWKKDASLLKCHLLPEFGTKRLNQITRERAQLFHAKLRNEKALSPAQCDHALKLLRSSLNLAVDWELIEKNPISRIKLFREDNRVEHYLNDDQLQRLMKQLKADRNRMVCDVILFLLSTGVRLNEALNARWAHIDREHKVWKIPAEYSKSKKIRSVPLNDFALKVIASLETERDYDYLFINYRTEKPLVNINKVWGRVRSEAGLNHLRLHDLRHQYASFLVNSGRSLYEVQQILGHSDPKVTQRYSHLSTRTLQAAANSASDCINAALEGAS
jgi:integrase